MCFSVQTIPTTRRIPASEVDRAAAGASPAFAVAVSEAGFPSRSVLDTSSTRATEGTPRPRLKRARRAWFEPNVSASIPVFASPTSVVDENLATAASSVDATLNADEENETPVENHETSRRVETPLVSPSVQPVTPSVSATPSVAAVGASAAREINAARALETPPPAPFAQLARAAQVGRDHDRRTRGGRFVENPTAWTATVERELDASKSRTAKLPQLATMNVICGAGSALRALAENIAKPSG